MKEAYAVGELAGEAHLVGDHQHGQVVRLAETANHAQHLAAELRVERRGHFVEQHHLGTHGQRPRNRHALLLAAGQLRREMLQLVLQADHRQQLLGPFARLALAQSST